MESEISKRIEQLQDEVRAGKRAEKHLVGAKEHVELLEAQVLAAKDSVSMEHRDVEELEKIGLRRLFSQIMGKLEKIRDVERQEYMQAVLEYRSLRQQIDLAKYEVDLLQQQVQRLPAAEKELSQLLDKTARKIKVQNTASAKKIRDIELLIDLSEARSKEIAEAQAVCGEIEQKIDTLLDHLRKVGQWSPLKHHPMHGKGRYSSYNKKSYIDRSQDEVIEINQLFDRLSAELGDIYRNHEHGLHIGEFETFIEDFYDHLITDWVLQKKLRNAINGTELVLDKVYRMTASLQTEREKEAQQRSKWLADKELLLIDHFSPESE